MILDAALRVYLENGYSRTSMDAIADAAGVTKPVLYDGFASKRELFTALEEREERRLLESLEASLPSGDDLRDPARAIAKGFTAFFRAVLESPDSYRLILLEEQGTDPAVARRGNRTRTEQAKRIAVIAEEALVRTGVTDAGPTAHLLGHAMVGIGESLGRLMLAEPGRWDPEELGRTVAVLVMRGVSGFE